MDSASALMGCSIAWYHMVIEAMADGGVKNGVPRALAYKLAAKSMEGSARLVMETGKQPGVVCYSRHSCLEKHKVVFKMGYVSLGS